MGLALDFITNLDEGKGFKDHLDNDFDFSQFKVTYNYKCVFYAVISIRMCLYIFRTGSIWIM